MEAITSAMTTGFSTAATDMLGAIGSILPVVIPVAAAMAVIGIGYKVFKRFTGRSSS